MDAKKICPHCGGTQFMAYIKRGGIVETDGLDKEGNQKFKIIKEGGKDNFEVEIIKCVKCQNDITQDDLVESGKCKKCGKIMNPADLNENGICPVCAMLDANPNIANMSKDDLQFMLAKLMMQNNSVKKDIAAKENKAAKAEAKATPKMQAQAPAPQPQAAPAAEISADDVLNNVLGGAAPEAASAAPAGDEEGAKKGTRKKLKKGATAPAGETTAESAQDTADAQEEIANSQDAPFPEVDNGVMDQAAQPQQQAEQPIGAGNDGTFKMFDEGEEQPF